MDKPDTRGNEGAALEAEITPEAEEWSRLEAIQRVMENGFTLEQAQALYGCLECGSQCPKGYCSRCRARRRLNGLGQIVLVFVVAVCAMRGAVDLGERLGSREFGVVLGLIAWWATIMLAFCASERRRP